jgi:hypothetical protein
MFDSGSRPVVAIHDELTSWALKQGFERQGAGKGVAVCTGVDNPFMCTRLFYHKLDPNGRFSGWNPHCHQRWYYLNWVEPPQFRGSTRVQKQGNDQIHLTSLTQLHHITLPLLTGTTCVYSAFLGHCHLLQLSRSDVNRKRRIEFAPFRSLHEFLLVNQKAL